MRSWRKNEIQFPAVLAGLSTPWSSLSLSLVLSLCLFCIASSLPRRSRAPAAEVSARPPRTAGCRSFEADEPRRAEMSFARGRELPFRRSHHSHPSLSFVLAMWPFSSSASPDSAASTSAPIASSSSAAADRCPVDETTRQKWLAAQAASGNPQSHPMAPASSSSSSPAPQPKGQPVQLSTERETSTIPRFSADSLPELASPEGAASYATPQSENWVYPSQDQFYRAMERKNHNPRAEDMQTIVPIHNAVNERAWKEVLEWEKGYGGEECGGVRLMTFRGTPGKMTPKSFLNQWVFG